MAKRLLIVDDTPAVANALAALVRSLGYEAEAVYDGELALKKIAESPPDLLLLDLHMPGMSGWDVLRIVRSDPRNDSLAIIACSAASSTQHRRGALEMGAQDFIPKDEAFEQLDPVIRRHLGE